MERYERLKVLGVGSFGKVYLMRHRTERRLVCAKIIKIKNIPRKEREACRTEVRCKEREPTASFVLGACNVIVVTSRRY